MENNKNKKSVKFQGDMFNFCDFIQVFVFTRNHHLKCRAVIRYLYFKGKTCKEIHGELSDVYGSSAPSYTQVKFWVG